jgi:hypothetical protein
MLNMKAYNQKLEELLDKHFGRDQRTKTLEYLISIDAPAMGDFKS